MRGPPTSSCWRIPQRWRCRNTTPPTPWTDGSRAGDTAWSMSSPCRLSLGRVKDALLGLIIAPPELVHGIDSAACGHLGRRTRQLGVGAQTGRGAEEMPRVRDGLLVDLPPSSRRLAWSRGEPCRPRFLVNITFTARSMVLRSRSVVANRLLEVAESNARSCHL